MEVEPVSCIKQRGNRSHISQPIKDDREEEIEETPVPPEEEAPKPGLLWRAGSGLWGITSVRLIAQMSYSWFFIYICMLKTLLTEKVIEVFIQYFHFRIHLLFLLIRLLLL